MYQGISPLYFLLGLLGILNSFHRISCVEQNDFNSSSSSSNISNFQLNATKETFEVEKGNVNRTSRSSNWNWGKVNHSENSTKEFNSSNEILQRVVFLDTPIETNKNNKPEIVDKGPFLQGKKILQEESDNVEIIESRGHFTFLDFSTSPIPPSTSTISNACSCVPYYLCDEGQVVTGIIDIRSGWGCNSVLEVCCRNPKPTHAPTTLSPIDPNHGITVQPGFIPRCGTLNPNGINARILGFKDSETQYGEYPWMGAVLESKLIRGKWVLQFLCGASLITPRVILTAAHCVKAKRISNLIIRMGEWDTQTTNEFYPYQDLKVSEIVIHPQFYGGGLYNDIALVFLQNSAILAPHIDTICLPSYDIHGGSIEYDGSSCWATGWGKNAFGPTGQYQAILKEVELAITPRDECQSSLRKTNLGSKFNLHESFICAGGQKGLDTCVGDGGGPLVCPSLHDPWRYVIVGIISWGVNCGTYSVPGVYVNVPKFRKWIDSEIISRMPFYNSSRWTIPKPQQGG